MVEDWLTTAGKKRKAVALASIAADAGDELTGLGGGKLYAAASLETQQQVDELWVNSEVTCYAGIKHSKNCLPPLSQCVNVLRLAAKKAGAAGWTQRGLSGKDYLTLLLLEADSPVPTRGKCDPCKAYADGKNAEHNLARQLSGQLQDDNAKINARWNPVNNLARKLSGKLQEDNAKLNAKWGQQRLQASIELNTNLRAAGYDLEPDLTTSQVQAQVDRIQQLPLIRSMLAGKSSGYIGIGRYDGSDIVSFSDPQFKEPYKSMTRRGGYEQLLVHAGSGADITVKEAEEMVTWVPLYWSFNRVNTELVETAMHAALHHLPLGVRLHRARGRGASAYKVVEGELLLSPFVLFLMVFKGGGLYSEHDDTVAWNPAATQPQI